MLASVIIGCQDDVPNAPSISTAVLSTSSSNPTVAISTSTATLLPTATPLPTATSLPTATPLPTATLVPGSETVMLLTQTQFLPLDLNELALKFKLTDDVTIEASNNFKVGDTDEFWVVDNSISAPTKFKITAQLLHLTDHSYWWVEKGYSVPTDDIVKSAIQFETNVYPTNHNLFGTEWSPGVDNDVRIHILMARIPGVAGYYSASNQYSQAAVSYSNQREMFFMNLQAVQPGNTYFDSTLAHEFQHMIHWHQDPNEETWINEGLSELAKFVNGYGLSSFSNGYLQKPNTQLTTWGRDDATRRVNYGASFLFCLYLYDKFGTEGIQKLVSTAQNGIAGVEQMLIEMDNNKTFNQLFTDFTVANYLNDVTLDQGQWGYSLPEIKLASVNLHQTHRTLPIQITESVQQYGVHYIKIENPTTATLKFSGSTTTTLLNTQAYSGRYLWYSNRGDRINTTLTRAFDLTNLTEATLHFWAWYDIEADWDYAYINVSSDGGKTWDNLTATSTTLTNPVGHAYGPGFTGMSGSTPKWIKETVDLNTYVGTKILVRFEYITDDAVNLPGFAIDDISIPQLDYMYNAEQEDDGWESEGFIKTDNILPQSFSVQIITFNNEGKAIVTQLPLDENNNGQYTFANLKQSTSSQTPTDAILIISAQAPVTTQAANYRYSITP